MKNTRQIEVQEEKPVKRIGVFTFLDGTILERFRNDLPNLLAMPLKERMAIFEKIPGLVQDRIVFENITPTVGFQQITKALSGNLTNVADLAVNYHAFGTGTNPATAGDTQLQTEGYRKAITSRGYAGEKTLYTIFYDLTEAVGSWTEMALFINGAAGANTGILWDRTLSSITKSNSQALTLDYEEVFSNA